MHKLISIIRLELVLLCLMTVKLPKVRNNLFEEMNRQWDYTVSKNKSFKRIFMGTKCFPVNFAKFLRTPFLQNTSGRLLLGGYFSWNLLKISNLGRFQSFNSHWFFLLNFQIPIFFSNSQNMFLTVPPSEETYLNFIYIKHLL